MVPKPPSASRMKFADVHNLKYLFALVLVGLAQIALAFTSGKMSWLLWWSGLSWIFVGCAYGGFGAGIFGKRADGRMASVNVCLLFPYLFVTWFLWYMQQLLTKEPPHDEIIPGLWLGRRCSGNELPSGVKLIVDMTSEFPEPADLRSGRSYVCVPTLDASVPSDKAFANLVQTIVASPVPVYVHCALGHGRSAAVMTAVLVAKGDAATIEQAEESVKEARPRVEINPTQRKLLHRWFSAHILSPS